MRDVLIIGIACVAAILLGGWLYFYAPGTPPHAPGTSFAVLDQGSDSGSLTERKNYRIKSQEELDQLWKMLHGTGAPSAVDFSANEVIAVFDGTHTSGGYGIRIESITDAPSGAREVAILHTTPDAGCSTTDAITSPFEIVLLPKSESSFTHTDDTAVTPCK